MAAGNGADPGIGFVHGPTVAITLEIFLQPWNCVVAQLFG
jgi:hypothetical protein